MQKAEHVFTNLENEFHGIMLRSISKRYNSTWRHSQNSIIDKFENIPWLVFLRCLEIAGKNVDKIYFSPSLEIENAETKNGANKKDVLDCLNALIKNDKTI